MQAQVTYSVDANFAKYPMGVRSLGRYWSTVEQVPGIPNSEPGVFIPWK